MWRPNYAAAKSLSGSMVTDLHQADLDFIARVRKATLRQLQMMLAGSTVAWKWEAIRREIERRTKDERR